MELHLSDQTIAFSVRVARATMGVDALYRKETGLTDLHDGLVVLNMSGVRPEAYENYQAAQAHLAELAVGCTTPRRAPPSGPSANGDGADWMRWTARSARFCMLTPPPLHRRNWTPIRRNCTVCWEKLGMMGI